MATSEQAFGLTDSADHLTDIVWKIGTDGQMLYGNEHWRTFSGEENNAGQRCSKFPPAEFIHPEDLPRLAEMWQSAQIDSGEFRLELRLKRGIDSKYIWHLTRAWPVFPPTDRDKSSSLGVDLTGGQKPVCWLATCTDVHDLKAVQQMFQLVIDNIPISIFWKDRNSSYLGCNKLFASDVGRTTTEEIIGKNDYDNPSSKEQSDFFRECDRRVMESGVAEYHIIEPQLRAGGKQAWLDTNKIPLRDAGGEVIGVLGMYEDITERISVEQQREDFVATLTHDLKNPLLGTNRVLDLLVAGKMGAIDETQKSVLIQVKESNTSLITMIQNLLDVYRYDSIKHTLETASVDLCRLIEGVVNRNAIAVQSKLVAINLKVPEGETMAECCASAIERVLQNLIDNAIKFSPREGVIEVELFERDDHYHLSVRDNGPGIDNEEQAQLFSRFWQGSPGKKYSHGTGLGLYVCKQIIEAHRGKIACNSGRGIGTTFEVILPKTIQVPV